LGAHHSKYAWKASDWIIQEIGVAIGREMSLILLVEEGVRVPGAFQGNIERISFSRQSPQQSFARILEMLTALRPTPLPALEPETRTTVVEAEIEQEAKKDGTKWWLEPKPAWRQEEYELALVLTMETDNGEGEKLVARAYLDSIEPSETNKRASWEAYQEYLKVILGKGGVLSKLEELSKLYSENDEVQRYLGMAYENYQEYDKAAEPLKRAAELALGQRQKLADLGKAALCLLRSGRKVDAQLIVDEMKQLASMTDKGNEILVSTLREIADLDADSDVYFGLTEHMLELKPDDITARFQIALRYSQEKQQELSLFHYLRIPERQRAGGAWNNLGVQYENLGLNSKSIKAYRRAEQLGETLAMSNLAQSLTSTGFLEEATEICNRAVQMENYHRNVGSTIARIKELPEEEENKEKELVKKALSYSEFFRTYGKALTLPDLEDRIETWEGPKCHLRLEIRAGILVAEGAYESALHNMLGLAQAYLANVGGIGAPAVSRPVRHLVKYVGKLAGYTVKAEMTDVEQEEEPNRARALATPLTSPSPVSRKVLMVITDSLTEIRVYEKESPEGQRFYKLKKVGQ
jgi:tetratricopeptide (TPR) repeat protein